MAEIPLPMGIGDVLVDIAEGIGRAAAALPTNSRSFVGAVAMKTARMRIDFEMARVESERSAGVGIRMKEIVGVGTAEEAVVTRSASKGFIEFEVVAIGDDGDSAAPTLTAAPDPARRAAIAAAKAEARKAAEAKAVAESEAKAQAEKAAQAKAATIDAARAQAREAATARAAAAAKPAPGKDG